MARSASSCSADLFNSPLSCGTSYVSLYIAVGSFVEVMRWIVESVWMV